MAEQDQEFVEYVVKAIVEKPDAVKVNRKLDEMGVLLELTVDPEDMGKIIGKEGRTAKSLRTLLRLVGVKANARINLKIIEPEGGSRPAKEEKVEVKKEEKEDKEDKGEKEEKEEEKATEIV